MQRSVRRHSSLQLVWGLRVSITVRIWFLLLASKELAADVPANRFCGAVPATNTFSARDNVIDRSGQRK